MHLHAPSEFKISFTNFDNTYPPIMPTQHFGWVGRATLKTIYDKVFFHNKVDSHLQAAIIAFINILQHCSLELCLKDLPSFTLFRSMGCHHHINSRPADVNINTTQYTSVFATMTLPRMPSTKDPIQHGATELNSESQHRRVPTLCTPDQLRDT